MIELQNLRNKIVQHLIFVNTRHLAERVAHHLAERLGEEFSGCASWQSVPQIAS